MQIDVTANAEPIAFQLKEHQEMLRDWEFAELVAELHRWVPIFDREFDLQLPSYPVVGVKRLRRAYAYYCAERSEVGTRDNIVFNSKDLDRDPALILRTLLHEQIHLHQRYHGKPGARNYHNREFRAKALACGLIVDSWGCTGGHTAVFTDVLKEYGINLEAFVPPAENVSQRAETGHSLKTFRCECTRVLCDSALHATCQACGGRFRRAQRG